jgi:predicted small secreted protein
MSTPKRLIATVFVVFFAAGLSACGDTWEGLKQDTGENMQKTGSAIEGAGEKVKDD